MCRVFEHTSAVGDEQDWCLSNEFRLAVLEVVGDCLLLDQFCDCPDVLETLFAIDLSALKLHLVKDYVCFHVDWQL